MRPSPRRILIALAVLALAAACTSHATSQERKAAAPVRLFGQTPVEFAARRAAVRTAAGSAMVLISGEVYGLDPERARFRTQNDLMYLTGVEAPGAWLALLPPGDPSGKREILFLPSPNARETKWEDDTTSPNSPAPFLGGIESVQNAAFLWHALKPSILKASAVYVQGPVGERAKHDPAGTIEEKLRGIRPDVTIEARVRRLIDPLRRIKSPGEIDNLRKAADVTADGEYAAATAIRKGVSEISVEGAIIRAFRSRDAICEGFLSVVGSGPNSCILHHFSGPRRMQSGDLVVCDIGAEWNYYSADITRTFPCGGRFTARQRELYQLVLDVQRACEKAVVPGKSTIDDLDEVARETLGKSPLRAVGSDGSRHTMDEFLPHSVGHYIGMDVHDVGAWPARLDVGTVFTIEPGIYIPREGIGIRIEDDYLVTARGVEKLSAALPSTASDIEAMMRGWRPKPRGRAQ